VHVRASTAPSPTMACRTLSNTFGSRLRLLIFKLRVGLAFDRCSCSTGEGDPRATRTTTMTWGRGDVLRTAAAGRQVSEAIIRHHRLPCSWLRKRAAHCRRHPRSPLPRPAPPPPLRHPCLRRGHELRRQRRQAAPLCRCRRGGPRAQEVPRPDHRFPRPTTNPSFIYIFVSFHTFVQTKAMRPIELLGLQ
jgi:hypothetical protein